MKSHLTLLTVLLVAPLAAQTTEGGEPFWTVSLAGMAQPISPVVYSDGRYAVADAAHSIFFSPDLKSWERLQFEEDTKLRWVRHDGQRWVAATRNGKLATSTDRRTWTPWFASNAATDEAVVWRGRYWKSVSTVLGVALFNYEKGRYDRGKSEVLPEWDGQLLNANAPAAIWRQENRLRTVRRSGLHYVSDNGDYWSVTGGIGMNDVREAIAAEGNGRVVVSIVAKDGNGGLPLISVQEGTTFPAKVETPFTRVTGLAYGLGRFVMLAATKDDPKPGFFESVDGRTWTPVGERRADLVGVVYGAAGFVAQTKEMLVIYQPEPLPEQPMPAWEPVEVPTFRFKDFGSNFVGSGKQRREIPKTPDQIKLDELLPIGAAAYKGDVPAGVQMGLLMLEGKYVEMNPWRAELAFRAGIEAKVPAAARGYAELLTRWKPETPRNEIMALYRASAELGDGPAMSWMVFNLDSTLPGAAAEFARWRDGAMTADPTFPARWAKLEILMTRLEAARAGDAAAVAAVLPVVTDGDITPADWKLARGLADAAAEKGSFDATMLLVQRFQSHRLGGVDSSVYPDADYQRQLERAAAADHKPAVMQYLDNLMRGTYGYNKNEEKALARARQLADKGDTDGMFYVGMILQGSSGPQRDPVAATEWMQKAADAGHALAKRWLQMQAAQGTKP